MVHDPGELGKRPAPLDLVAVAIGTRQPRLADATELFVGGPRVVIHDCARERAAAAISHEEGARSPTDSEAGHRAAADGP